MRSCEYCTVTIDFKALTSKPNMILSQTIDTIELFLIAIDAQCVFFYTVSQILNQLVFPTMSQTPTVVYCAVPDSIRDFQIVVALSPTVNIESL